MTVITFRENSIEINGHAPDKVVCHALSAIMCMVANYVVANDWGKAERKDGYMKIYDIKERYQGEHLFIAMMFAIKDIQEEYPGNIEVKYCN